MEYCIAGDDGSAGIWNRPFDVDLDGDGRLDAIGLDLDGDGLRDDALADFDGDDVADHAVFDVDNDGTPESYFIDDGSGTWAVAVDRGGQLRWYGLDGVEHTGGPLVDFDGFGGLDDRPSPSVSTYPVTRCSPAHSTRSASPSHRHRRRRHRRRRQQPLGLRRVRPGG